MWRHDIQHNDIQNNNTQHNDIKHKNNQHNAIQHKNAALSTTTLRIMTLNSYPECHYADCCHAECRYAECHGAVHGYLVLIFRKLKLKTKMVKIGWPLKVQKNKQRFRNLIFDIFVSTLCQLNLK